MFCPRHPKIAMTESGRRYAGEPIMHCAVCVETMHAKFEVLMALPHKFHNRRLKQIVLPPVMMSERWP